MRHSHSGARLVDVLSAGTGGVVGVNADILHINLDIIIVVLEHRGNVQRGEGGVAPGVGVKRRDAHQAVHALFTAKVAVGMIAVHFKGDGFNARFIAFKVIQELDGKAHPLAVAGIHAVQHLCPVLCLRAAGAGVQ